MNSKFFEIGGIVFELRSRCKIADSVLFSSFRTEPREPDEIIEISESGISDISGSLIKSYSNKEIYEYDGKRFLYTYYPDSGKKVYFACSEYENNITRLAVDYDEQLYDSMLFSAVDFPGILMKYNSFLFHCSFIIADGKAILFSGESGKGKTTQAELWNKYRNSEIINGDRAILKFDSDKLRACGTPYCGSSNTSVNKSAEVAAVIFPEHAKENSIIKFKSSFDAVPALMSQFSLDNQENILKAFSFAEEIFKKTPMFRLPCLKDETAVAAAENAIKNL